MTRPHLSTDQPVIVKPFGSLADRRGVIVGTKPGRRAAKSGRRILLYIVRLENGTVGQYRRPELTPVEPEAPYTGPRCANPHCTYNRPVSHRGDFCTPACGRERYGEDFESAYAACRYYSERD